MDRPNDALPRTAITGVGHKHRHSMATEKPGGVARAGQVTTEGRRVQPARAPARGDSTVATGGAGEGQMSS